METTGTLTPQETEKLARRGLRLAQFTVAYNVVEGIIAVTAASWPDSSQSLGSASTPASNPSPPSWSESASPPSSAWLDPVAGFIIAAFAIHEGKEAWEGELVEDDDDDD